MSQRHLIIIPGTANALPPAKLLKIRESAPGFALHYMQNDSVTPGLLSETEIIFGCPRPETLCKAPRLGWLHLPFAGAGPYGDLRLYANQSVMLTNARGVYGAAAAEHVLGMALALLRRIPDYVRQQDRREWARQEESRELSGSSVLVAGMGDLGKNTAARFRAMGCRITGIRRNALERPPEADEIHPLHRLGALLPGAGIVINCLPATAHTEGVFNGDAFKAMRPGSIFINAGQGAAVVEPALMEALTSGRLWGAAIDAARREPLPGNHPFWTAPNLLISPRAAAASPLVSARNFELFLDLLARYTAGRSLYNRVDFFSGY